MIPRGPKVFYITKKGSRSQTVKGGKSVAAKIRTGLRKAYKGELEKGSLGQVDGPTTTRHVPRQKR